MLLSRKLCFHYSEKEAGRQKGDCGPDAGKYRLLPSGIPYKGNKGKSPYPSSSVLWLGFGISAYHRNAQKGFWINGYKKKIYSKKPLFQKRQRLKSNAADRNRTVLSNQKYRKKGALETSSRLRCSKSVQTLVSLKLEFANAIYLVELPK